MRVFQFFTINVSVLLIIGVMTACKEDNSKFIGVSSSEFYNNYRHLLAEGGALVIDGRAREMFEDGHLQHAINIDADDENLLQLLKQHADEPLIVVYCTTNRRTGKIVNTLSTFYEGEVIYIDDGIRGWQRNGLPLSGF